MKITPLEIRQKTFEKVFRGYDKDEVHAFMSSLSNEWERALDENKEMKIKLEACQKEVEKLRQVESSLFKTLKTAEDTGANLIDQANKAAELHIREAQMKADDTVKNANEKAKKIVSKAEKTSRRILEQMADAVKNIENDYYRLTSLKEDLLTELKNLSTDTLEKIEKHKNQKDKFDFEEHLKKAKSLVRMASADDEEEQGEETLDARDEPPAEKAEEEDIVEEEQKKENRSFFDEID